MFYFANENVERVRLKLKFLASWVAYTSLTNMFDVFAIALYYVFKATPPFTDRPTSVEERL